MLGAPSKGMVLDAVWEQEARQGLELSSQPYCRVWCEERLQTERMRASWCPGLPTAPHDHGCSTGRIQILIGDFLERRFIFAAGQLSQVSEQRLSSGQASVCPPGTIHSLELVSSLGLTSHVYRPISDFMRLFDVVSEELLRVSHCAGAWLPVPESKVLERSPFARWQFRR
ncbi:MAG: hypothetical protein MK135_10205 [Polyangiaceae bacterium]|nr:hypothetical protein [Polyangiaceae bacterium]